MGKMNTAELVVIFECADEPAVAAAKWWASPDAQSGDSAAVLRSVLARHGGVRSVDAARELARSAENWGKRNRHQAGTAVESFVAQGVPAALVLAAALLEATGGGARAAELFGELEQRTDGDVRSHFLLGAARTLAAVGRRIEASQALGEAVRQSASARTLTSAGSLLRRLSKDGALPSRRKCRIAIVGNVTFDLLVSTLGTMCFADGIAAEFWTGGFGQHVQEILSPDSALAKFQPDILIIACDWRVLELTEEASNPGDVVAAKVEEFKSLWNVARERLRAHVVQFGFEVPSFGPYGRLSTVLPGGKARLLREVNRGFFDAERGAHGLTVIDIDLISGTAGKRCWHAPAMWYAAKQYPAAEALPELARRLTATIRGVLGLTKKCVALDLDGTLWGGIIGEDGLKNLRLGGSNSGEAFVAFQAYLRDLKQRGILLAVCSKNNEEDARLPFEQHPDMVLKLSDISAFVANWNSKDQNLREVARLLNIGLDSIVFVDDNPVERRRVKRALPEVHVVDLPPDPADYIIALEEQLPFEALGLSEEDRQRSATFAANAGREALRTSTATVGEYLAALDMTAELRPFDEADLGRITQLINKTNQFNLTTPRMQESQLAALIGVPGVYTQSMRLRDRYSNYGLTGVLIARLQGEALCVDTWLMSCRVMGRRVEEAMIGAAMRHAAAAGLARVEGEFIRTAKNKPVERLFVDLGFAEIGPTSRGGIGYARLLSLPPLAQPAGLTVVDLTAERAPVH
jgi:FkbH-like protein